ncbi:uncharacterized protein BJ171DRAFT_301379 [Polychytrium aggregatum]|uniref:uncharacterized protein n=1 Tax=Polychytrium aggregatum TaxID=110093 RepID=UPI0022FDEBE0|nr:uncharacterized protein BJ171DRAFT_301379 [Polychytrium aggregatum]KAI9193213.1 hypothetical protein BJ171DRAFT_301379 [Polychytrium aggregatum]
MPPNRTTPRPKPARRSSRNDDDSQDHGRPAASVLSNLNEHVASLQRAEPGDQSWSPFNSVGGSPVIVHCGLKDIVALDDQSFHGSSSDLELWETQDDSDVEHEVLNQFLESIQAVPTGTDSLKSTSSSDSKGLSCESSRISSLSSFADSKSEPGTIASQPSLIDPVPSPNARLAPNQPGIIASEATDAGDRPATKDCPRISLGTSESVESVDPCEVPEEFLVPDCDVDPDFSLVGQSSFAKGSSAVDMSSSMGSDTLFMPLPYIETTADEPNDAVKQPEPIDSHGSSKEPGSQGSVSRLFSLDFLCHSKARAGSTSLPDRSWLEFHLSDRKAARAGTAGTERTSNWPALMVSVVLFLFAGALYSGTTGWTPATTASDGHAQSDWLDLVQVPSWSQLLVWTEKEAPPCHWCYDVVHASCCPVDGLEFCEREGQTECPNLGYIRPPPSTQILDQSFWETLMELLHTFRRNSLSEAGKLLGSIPELFNTIWKVDYLPSARGIVDLDWLKQFMAFVSEYIKTEWRNEYDREKMRFRRAWSFMSRQGESARQIYDGIYDRIYDGISNTHIDMNVLNLQEVFEKLKSATGFKQDV